MIIFNLLIRKQRSLISAVFIFIHKYILRSKQTKSWFFFLSRISPHNSNVLRLVSSAPLTTNKDITIDEFEEKMLLPFIKSNHPHFRKRSIKFLRILGQEFTSNGHSNLSFSVSKNLASYIERLESEYKNKEYSLYQFQEIRKMGKFTKENLNNLLNLARSLSVNDSPNLIYNTILTSMKLHFEFSKTKQELVELHEILSNFETLLIKEIFEGKISKLYSLVVRIDNHNLFSGYISKEEKEKYKKLIRKEEMENHPILNLNNKEILELKSSLENNLLEFNSFLNQHKKISIVGNSPIEIGQNNGKLIDSNELVIRFNNYNTNLEFQNDYGCKTSILVHSGATNVVIKKSAKFDFLLLSGFDLLYKKRKVDFIKDLINQGHKVVVFPDEIWRMSLNELHSTPSAGYLTIKLLKSLWKENLNLENIFGFSFKGNNKKLFNSNYHNKSQSYNKHDWNKEQEILLKIFN